MNKRKLLTLLLSLLIHLISFIILWTILPKKKELSSISSKRVQLNLNDFIISKPTKLAQKITPMKPKPKPKISKKANLSSTIKPSKKIPTISKKPTIKQKPKRVIKKIKKEELQKTSSKTLQKNQPSKKDPLSALAKALGTPTMQKPKLKPPSIEQINNSFLQKEFYAIYKDEFEHFSFEQKRFIRDNLFKIQHITQHYLTLRGYPYFAGKMGQQGTNVVEFFLLPNGDITDLKIITPTGFEQLDQNSLDTIKAAYKDYPRPKEKTKIRFYIHYSIY